MTGGAFQKEDTDLRARDGPEGLWVVNLATESKGTKAEMLRVCCPERRQTKHVSRARVKAQTLRSY